MKLIDQQNPGFVMRSLAVVLIVLAILVVSFCATVMTVIYIHADEKGMLPAMFSLSDQITQPVITILPPLHPAPNADSTDKRPKYQI
ncbi:MAG: hypothetical protein RLO04_02245 [Limnobacter sp.]|uniref:hypothetical protein n=1 Tax=Limnobacter sp. TaxID=2003368 RepID=UPI0032EF2128